MLRDYEKFQKKNIVRLFVVYLGKNKKKCIRKCKKKNRTNDAKYDVVEK